MSESNTNELIRALESAEDQLADAEDVVWNVSTELCDEETEQSLDELVEELWRIQNRITEIKETASEE
ncbi:hypothetical protein [Natrinema hispanicum]|uniref:Uncharacterized protein n=1 Tax=Natrinema hispanicum TaxID=392421 RepID=A0A1I0J788_9EURY|nr:hypothetical protein [Natrinema hispanicum]SEU05048.1 hypothetical protein SAMN04488694_13221 [Natrinema hispanicum]